MFFSVVLFSFMFQTLYIVETRIESLKGAADFCRVSTMCHLKIEISKLFSGPVDYCLTYEVLADQTMWAVCGSNAGELSSNNCFIAWKFRSSR